MNLTTFAIFLQSLCLWSKKFASYHHFFSSLFKKVDMENSGHVTWDQFVQYWLGGNLFSMGLITKVFYLLKQDKNFLMQDDLRPILLELLATQGGLDFLQNTLVFQERYAETDL